MISYNNKENKIIELLLENKELQSSDIHNKLIEKKEDISLVTVKRMLSEMVNSGTLVVHGSGRSTSYSLSSLGRIYYNVDSSSYNKKDPDSRKGFDSYNFDLLSSFNKDLFSKEELNYLSALTKSYQEKVEVTTLTLQTKELERITIELSWKSSKIEGNTYSLLDTERLILENKPSEGKTEMETQMILNHKNAFSFIYQNRNSFKEISHQDIENIHRLLVEEMDISYGLRKNPVGISGSKYLPLDNIYQIEEALKNLLSKVNNIKSPYGKALLCILGISYIQPFEDGNKRTSRLIADAILLAYHCAPLSYRSVDEKEYKEAIIVFYELNSIMPFKKIFIEQYEFAAKNYFIK